MEDLIGTIAVFAFFIISALVKNLRRQQQQRQLEPPAPPPQRTQSQEQQHERPALPPQRMQPQQRQRTETPLRRTQPQRKRQAPPPRRTQPQRKRQAPPPRRTQPQQQQKAPQTGMRFLEETLRSLGLDVPPGVVATGPADHEHWTPPPRSAAELDAREDEDEYVDLLLSSDEILARALAEAEAAEAAQRARPGISLSQAADDRGELFRDAVILQSVLSPNRRT